MVQASQTTLSAAGIWAIVIVMVSVLAFWLVAVALADRSQARASGRARLAGDTAPVLSGAWAGGSMAGARAPEIPGEAEHEPIVAGAAEAPGTAQGRHARDEAVPQADIPAQRTAGRHERPTMPRQRSGEADRAERSYTGQAAPGDGEGEQER